MADPNHHLKGRRYRPNKDCVLYPLPLTLRVKSLKLVIFESLGKVSHSHSIVTMVASCIVSEIKRDIGRKSRFFIPGLAFDAPSEYCITFAVDKLEWCACAYLSVKRVLRYV